LEVGSQNWHQGQYGTSADLGFKGHLPRIETGHPLLNETHSFETGCPKLAWCQFEDTTIPVSKLGKKWHSVLILGLWHYGDQHKYMYNIEICMLNPNLALAQLQNKCEFCPVLELVCLCHQCGTMPSWGSQFQNWLKKMLKPATKPNLISKVPHWGWIP
jgi:hypothetical protein